MSLKRSYATEAEVPTEQKANYVPKGGRYVLDVEGFDNVDSVLAKNTELLGKVSGHAGELQEKQTEIERLTGELQNAKGSTLPRGHKAVPTADAELVDAVKAEGITTPDAFKTLKTEHGQYKAKAETTDRRARFADVGKKLKWNDDTPDVLDVVPNLPEIEDREVTVNGKVEKVPHAKLVMKNATGQDEVSYRPFGEWFAETHPALLRSVQAQPAGGTRVPGSTGGAGSPPADEDMIERRRREKEAARQAAPNALMPQKPAAPAATV